MEIIISNTNSKPIYEQIVMQIKEMIMNGKLKPNDPLPSMRKLAKDLHISIITTQRAYDELAKSTHNNDFIREENLRRIEKGIQEICTLARQSGVTKEEIQNLVTMNYEEM